MAALPAVDSRFEFFSKSYKLTNEVISLLRDHSKPTILTKIDLSILVAVIISCYLTVGEYSHAVCNLFTTVPAAVFTYNRLSDENANIYDYRATLFYWTIHGVLVAADDFFLNAFGYVAGKYLLLTTLLYVVSANTKEKSKEMPKKPMKTVSTTSFDEELAITDDTQMSYYTPYRLATDSLDNLSTAYSFGCRTPELTVFSDDNYTYEASMKTLTESEKHSEIDISPPLYMDIDRRSLVKNVKNGRSSFVTDSGADSTIPTTTTNSGSKSKFEPSSVLQKGGDQIGIFGRRLLDSSSGSSEYDNLMSVPERNIIFKWPYDSQTVVVTNPYRRAVMWALKTNALGRLIAQPTCGVLPPRSTVHVKLGVVDLTPETNIVTDRLAIDYSFVDDPTTVFDRSFLHSYDQQRRRKRLNIIYED
ncbi:hypothetical protein AB6A40_001596 [Gnathostoma spinigerum]|uniref:Major sperm protein n=1 Tax=Gnathostoma spinigerum TaxID=75299 RepID=A0ABD6EEF1_9BILA